MSDLTGTKGGSGVWQRIISEMPEHQVYIEPFWGRGTIAKKKKPALTIGVDRDPAAVESGRVLGALMFLGDGVQWVKDYFRLPGPAAGSSVARSSVASNGVARAKPKKAAPAAACTFGGIPWPMHFVYFDPPYLGCHGHYRHELTEAAHADLCRVFLALPCPAAISGYWTELYETMLKGCRRIDIPTVNRRGKRVTEILWMNYPPPRRYHDTRYVGADRRVRERIRRRVKNWQENLGDMGPAERQAVWEACDDVFKGR